MHAHQSSTLQTNTFYITVREHHSKSAAQQQARAVVRHLPVSGCSDGSLVLQTSYHHLHCHRSSRPSPSFLRQAHTQALVEAQPAALRVGERDALLAVEQMLSAARAVAVAARAVAMPWVGRAVAERLCASRAKMTDGARPQMGGK